MNLNEKLLQSIKLHDYLQPTEIQKRVIPLVIDCKDVLASAETGAGKTIAFVLPALQRLLIPTELKGRGPRVLVLTPTRELAEQVLDAVKKMAKFTSLRAGVITGGVPYRSQEILLSRHLDLLVATPGRLMDHMNQNRVDFSRLELFILDEADRMLDMGFIKDIEKIIEPMPKTRQTLLFSATLEGPVQKIARQFLNNPESVELASNTKLPSLINQQVYQVDDFNHKRAVLAGLLNSTEVWQTIVFTATKRSADRLSDELSSMNFDTAALHGDMKQGKRTRTLDRMRRGQIRVLVATDVAARGLDVKNITHVINFDLPKSVEDYIHRIGRTGRAGESGTAISFAEPREWSFISYIEKTTNQRLNRKTLEGLEPKRSLGNQERSSSLHKNRPSNFSRGHQSEKMKPGRYSKEDRFRSRRVEEGSQTRRDGRPRFSRDERPQNPRESRQRFIRDERSEAPRENRSRYSRDDHSPNIRGRGNRTETSRNNGNGRGHFSKSSNEHFVNDPRKPATRPQKNNVQPHFSRNGRDRANSSDMRHSLNKPATMKEVPRTLTRKKTYINKQLGNENVRKKDRNKFKKLEEVT